MKCEINGCYLTLPSHPKGTLVEVKTFLCPHWKLWGELDLEIELKFYFLSTLCERRLLPLCTNSKYRIFLFLLNTTTWGFCSFPWPLKLQKPPAPGALLLPTVHYHFTCKWDFFFFLLKFLFQNRHTNTEAQWAPVVVLMLFVFSKRFQSSYIKLRYCF